MLLFCFFEDLTCTFLNTQFPSSPTLQLLPLLVLLLFCCKQTSYPVGKGWLFCIDVYLFRWGFCFVLLVFLALLNLFLPRSQICGSGDTVSLKWGCISSRADDASELLDSGYPFVLGRYFNKAIQQPCGCSLQHLHYSKEQMQFGVHP